MGTRPPTPNGYQGLRMVWNGTYLTNDGQTVIMEDALSLADALEKALDDILDENSEMD